MSLTPRERLAGAAHGAPVDRPPCVCPGGMMNMVVAEAMEASGSRWPEAHTDPEKMAALARALGESGFENYGVPFCMTVEAEAMGATVDMGSATVEPHVVDSPLSSALELDRLRPMDLTAGRPRVVLEAIALLKGGDLPVVGNVTGPMSVAGTLVDMSALLKELRKQPEASARLLDFVTDQLVAYARAQRAAGADVLCISEPSGTGEILGARHFETYSLPCLNRVLDETDFPVKIVHICGRLHSIYPLLDRLHCDVFSFDAIVNPREIRPYLGQKAVMGNVNTHALGTMPPEKVADLTRTVMGNGVDIVAPACGLPLTTPLANIRAMVQAVRAEGEGGVG